MSGWKLTLPCTRAEAEALSGEVPELASLDPMPSLVTSEEDEATDRWRLDAYFEDQPDAASIAALIAAIPSARGAIQVAEPLPDEDWVTLSQQGLEPIRTGPFHVHSSHDAPDRTPGTINLQIDAGQAFGTGHHATTLGCLTILAQLHARGHRFRAIADIGTGTGLLAFAAQKLWPRAHITATDIDPVSIRVTADNAADNAVPLGQGIGAVALAVADGTAHPLVHARAPYDLIVANILAGPLITLAPALTDIAAPGTRLVLAGLITRQQGAVIAAYRRAGWRLDQVGSDPEWPALLLTLRARPGWRRPVRSVGKGGLPPGDFGAW